jgi:hypothetical protein
MLDQQQAGDIWWGSAIQQKKLKCLAQLGPVSLWGFSGAQVDARCEAWGISGSDQIG